MLISRAARDEGSIVPLVVGCTAIAAALVVVGVDLTAVFLARRALTSAADAAAVAAAQGVDTTRLYAGDGPRCGQPLPLDPSRSDALANDALDASAPGLRRTFADLRGPATAVHGGSVSVTLGGEVTVPFGEVLGWLDPALPNGQVHVSASSSARAPVAGGGC